MRIPHASIAAACLVSAGCGGGDLVLPAGRPPAGIEVLRGNEQSAPPGSELPEPIVVRVTDADSMPLADVPVVFALGPGAEGGSTTPDTALTDALGEAEAQWVLGDGTGEQRVIAEVVGAGLDEVSFMATAVEDVREPSADRSSITASPSTIEAGTGLAVITVTVRDGRGDPLQGASVALAATGFGNVLTQPSAPTDEDGVAQGTLQGIVPGERVVSAVVNGTVGLDETATVTVVTTPEPPEPAGLAFIVQPTDAEEDGVIEPAVAVAVVDAVGDVVPLSGIEIRLELIRDQGQGSDELEGDASRETESGVAVFPELAVDRDDSGYQLRATAPGRPELGSVDSEPFDVED